MAEPDRRKLVEVAFSTSLPCPPQLFAGRLGALEAYRGHVPIPRVEPLPPQPTNLAYIGAWGIGKTSILRYLLENESKDRFIAVEVTGEFKTLDKLLELTLRSIAFTFSRREKLKRFLNTLKEAGISPLRIPEEARADRVLLMDLFVKAWRVLERSGVEHCSLMVDDFHLLSSEDMLALRTLFQTLPERGCNYSLVVTSTPDPFVSPLTEPVSRFFKEKHFIHPFTLAEAEEAIRKPIEVIGLDLDFTREYLEELMDLTLGYPYFVKFVTGVLAGNHKRLTGPLLRKNKKRILEALGTAKFRDDFSRAPGETGKRIVIRMAELRASGGEPLGRFRAYEFRKIPRYSSYLDMLQAKGLVNRDERGVYSVYHPLFLEWVREFVLRGRGVSG